MADIGRQIDGMLQQQCRLIDSGARGATPLLTARTKKQTLREVMDNQQLPMGFRMAFLEYTKAAQVPWHCAS